MDGVPVGAQGQPGQRTSLRSLLLLSPLCDPMFLAIPLTILDFIFTSRNSMVVSTGLGSQKNGVLGLVLYLPRMLCTS